MAAVFESKALGGQCGPRARTGTTGSGRHGWGPAGLRDRRPSVGRDWRALRNGTRADGPCACASSRRQGGARLARVPGRPRNLRAHRSDLIRTLERRRSAARLRPPAATTASIQLMRVSAMPPSSIAKVTTGRSGSRSTPHACAIRRACRYLARLLANPGRQFHVLDLVAAGKAALDMSRDPADPAWCLTREMPASCSMRAPKRRIAGGSQRLTTTLRKRGRWRTLTGRRKLMPNANVWSGSWPVQSDSAGAIDVLRQHPNAPEARSPGLSAMAWPESASTTPHSASISTMPFGPVPTARICPILECLWCGSFDDPIGSSLAVHLRSVGNGSVVQRLLQSARHRRHPASAGVGAWECQGDRGTNTTVICCGSRGGATLSNRFPGGMRECRRSGPR